MTSLDEMRKIAAGCPLADPHRPLEMQDADLTIRIIAGVAAEICERLDRVIELLEQSDIKRSM